MIFTIRTDGATVAPEAPPRAPREPQDGPRSPQDGPRWPQDGPKTAPDGPKMAPMGAQERSKTAPRWSPELPQRTSRAPKTPLASHLGPSCPKSPPDHPKMSPKWLPDQPQRLQNDGEIAASLPFTAPRKLHTRSPNEFRHSWANALRTFPHLPLSASPPTAEAQKACKNRMIFNISAILRPLDDPQWPVQRGRGRR